MSLKIDLTLALISAIFALVSAEISPEWLDSRRISELRFKCRKSPEGERCACFCQRVGDHVNQKAPSTISSLDQLTEVADILINRGTSKALGEHLAKCISAMKTAGREIHWPERPVDERGSVFENEEEGLMKRVEELTSENDSLRRQNALLKSQASPGKEMKDSQLDQSKVLAISRKVEVKDDTTLVDLSDELALAKEAEQRCKVSLHETRSSLETTRQRLQSADTKIISLENDVDQLRSQLNDLLTASEVAKKSLEKELLDVKARVGKQESELIELQNSKQACMNSLADLRAAMKQKSSSKQGEVDADLIARERTCQRMLKDAVASADTMLKAMRAAEERSKFIEDSLRQLKASCRGDGAPTEELTCRNQLKWRDYLLSEKDFLLAECNKALNRQASVAFYGHQVGGATYSDSLDRLKSVEERMRIREKLATETIDSMHRDLSRVKKELSDCKHKFASETSGDNSIPIEYVVGRPRYNRIDVPVYYV